MLLKSLLVATLLLSSALCYALVPYDNPESVTVTLNNEGDGIAYEAGPEITGWGLDNAGLVNCYYSCGFKSALAIQTGGFLSYLTGNITVQRAMNANKCTLKIPDGNYTDIESYKNAINSKIGSGCFMYPTAATIVTTDTGKEVVLNWLRGGAFQKDGRLFISNGHVKIYYSKDATFPVDVKLPYLSTTGILVQNITLFTHPTTTITIPRCACNKNGNT